MYEIVVRTDLAIASNLSQVLNATGWSRRKDQYKRNREGEGRLAENSSLGGTIPPSALNGTKVLRSIKLSHDKPILADPLPSDG